MLLFDTFSQANLPPLVILREFGKLYSLNPFFFYQKTQNLTFREILLYQSPFTANLLLIAILAKFKVFFRKNSSIFIKRAREYFRTF